MVFQFYPNFNSSSIIIRFFRFCTTWNFNWNHPIRLCILEKSKFNYNTWDPTINYNDTYDLVPIITPALPSINSTHNVSTTTLKVLKNEFSRGTKIINYKAQNDVVSKNRWKKLLKESTFFQDHKHFIQISIFSRISKFHLLWKGFIKTRIRVLLQSIEKLNGILSFPNPKVFQPYNWRKVKESNECFWFIGLKILRKTNYDLTKVVKKFLTQIYQSRLIYDGCTVYVKYLKRTDIPEYLFRFKRFVQNRSKPTLIITINVELIIKSLIKFIPIF